MGPEKKTPESPVAESEHVLNCQPAKVLTDSPCFAQKSQSLCIDSLLPILNKVIRTLS